MWEEVSISLETSGWVFSFSVIGLLPKKSVSDSRKLRSRALSANFPERCQPEPGEGDGEGDRYRDPSAGGASSFVLHVFTNEGDGAEGGDRQEQSASDLEPKLVRGVRERAQRGANGAQNGTEGAAAARLVARNPRGDPQLSQGRDFAHDLDFNSPER